jgi:hypothetical protein
LLAQDLNDAVTMINKIIVAKQENAELDHAILNQEDVKLLGPGIELEALWSCNFFMASQEGS